MRVRKASNQATCEVLSCCGPRFFEEQIRLAKESVSNSDIVCADISHTPFREGSFDAVCSFYAIISIPRDEHQELLSGLNRILRPEGLALLCMGAGDLPADVGEFHGADMFWSHYDSERNLSMMKKAGFSVLGSSIIEDPMNPAAAHLFVLAQKIFAADLGS